MPEDLLKKQLGSARNPAQLAREFDVSEEAMKMRLRSL
jgi:Zn-dependent peptidase ImmA (M78 family)